MDSELRVKHTRTSNSKPLVTIHNLPGEGADLLPAEMRALARALIEAADECESLPVEGKYVRNVERTYSLKT